MRRFQNHQKERAIGYPLMCGRYKPEGLREIHGHPVADVEEIQS